LAALSLSPLAGLPVRAETWTNRAGHVINAQLVEVKGDQVILRHTNGRTWRLPLSSLNPADQRRARRQTETEQVPSELQACLKQAQDDIERSARFLEGGRITREEYVRRCRKIRERFEYLARQGLKLEGKQPDPALLDRLKQRLD